MRITIPTIGSRGDVQPFTALAQGLIRAGHSVTLASHPVMRTLVEAHGVPFAPIGPDIDLGREVAAIRLRSRNPVVGLVRGMRFSFDSLERSHEDILACCRQAELVVVPAQSAAGKNEAEKLNLPYLSVNLVPWGIPWDDPERPLYKRLRYFERDRPSWPAGEEEERGGEIWTVSCYTQPGSTVSWKKSWPAGAFRGWGWGSSKATE